MEGENNNVNQLLDMLYETVDEAKGAPFSGDKCLIPRDETLDLIEEIRAGLPSELKRAQEMIRARDEFVDKAKQEAERIRQQAEFEAKTLVSDSEVLIAARNKRDEIVRAAEERAHNMYTAANEYTEDALRRAEEAMKAALDEVHTSYVRFREASAEQMRRKQAELREKSDEIDKTIE